MCLNAFLSDPRHVEGIGPHNALGESAWGAARPPGPPPKSGATEHVEFCYGPVFAKKTVPRRISVIFEKKANNSKND